MSIRHHFLLGLVTAVLLSGASSALALDDGLTFHKKVEGKYVTVYEPAGLNAAGLAEQLDIRPSDEILAGRLPKSGDSGDIELVRMLDTLFIQVSDVLDMHLYSLKTNIKICRTAGELAEAYNRLFNANLGGRKSFYVYDLNSVYVSGDDFRAGIIGHELSHAIIGHYFAIPAPVKVQEVLAMYVEYNLRRSGRQ